MAFSKDRAIVAQNATGAAGAIVAALLTTEDTVDSALEMFNVVRTNIFEGSLALADGAIEGVTERAPAARKSYGGGGRSGGSQQSNDNGAGVALKFGKHNGRTIEDVFSTDPEYIEWLAETSNNDFIKGKCGEFLAANA